LAVEASPPNPPSAAVPPVPPRPGDFLATAGLDSRVRTEAVVAIQIGSPAISEAVDLAGPLLHGAEAALVSRRLV
jgi:hypothetical protein